MKKVIFAALFLLTVAVAGAQGYKQALGIRAGWISPGLEYRYYTSDQHSLRALLAFRSRGVHAHVLTEFYQYDVFPFSYQLIFFYGAGLHAGVESWDETIVELNRVYSETKSSFVAGLDGLIGVEYLFYEAPVKVGIEAKPFFDVFGRHGFDVRLLDFAFTVKYLF